MKKINKIYLILASLLAFWALFDFYHYFSFGKDMIVHYKTFQVSNLVLNNLFSGIIKILFAGLIIFIGLIKAKKNKKFNMLTTISILLCISIFSIWAISMYCLTTVTAQELYDKLYEESTNFNDEVLKSGLLHEFYNNNYSRYGVQYENPDFLENQIFESIAGNSEHNYNTGGSYTHFMTHLIGKRNKLIRSIDYPMETAVLLYDKTGNLIHASSDSKMYFDYYTEDEWNLGKDSTQGLHYGWIDISAGLDTVDWKDDLYARFHTTFSGVHSLYSYVLRGKGYFEGNEFKPVVLHYLSDVDIMKEAENNPQFSIDENTIQYKISEIDKTGNVTWNLQFDFSDKYKDKELTTIYITHPKMWSYQNNSINYYNTEYNNLVDLTKSLDLQLKNSADLNQKSLFRINELLIFDKFEAIDYYSKEYIETGNGEADFYLVTAIYSNPLACAIESLFYIYLITLILSIIIVLVLRHIFKKYLTNPIQNIADGMQDNWYRNLDFNDYNQNFEFKEVSSIKDNYIKECDRRKTKDNEILRLNTALNYAEEAEKNRRQMASNIAHELKTPLAIIHSYAEGLKEHIAEDKIDKYTDIILKESERVDKIVLEMLDLSRLEAGKVKLSVDEFSLIALTKNIFDKLEIPLKEKDLVVNYQFCEDFNIAADENRISQVIENFVTNAIKYTPIKGHIDVTIQNTNSGTKFKIENECEQLSDEDLNKIWDTFYRTDKSRSSAGTGLGLAIAKNIIELHGGKCSVKNTQTGVEFEFTI